MDLLGRGRKKEGVRLGSQWTCGQKDTYYFTESQSNGQVWNGCKGFLAATYDV